MAYCSSSADDSKEKITSGHLSICLMNNDLSVYRPPVSKQKPTKDYACNPWNTFYHWINAGITSVLNN